MSLDTVPQAVRAAVRARDEGRCRRCGMPGEHVHHRKLRGIGGTADPVLAYGMANLVTLCHNCHSWIHLHPEQGYLSGFLVHSWVNPEDAVIVLGSGASPLTLKADGTVSSSPQLALF